MRNVDDLDSDLDLDQDNSNLHGIAMNATTCKSTRFMEQAMRLAQEAFDTGDVPVGAVIVHAPTGTVVSEARNEKEYRYDPTAHAEILAIRAACDNRQSPRLQDCDMYVTLEPCAMCATAISLARVRRLYFAAYDPKGGGVDHGPRIFQQPTCHHTPEVIGGIMEEAASGILKAFFQGKR